MEEEPYKLKFKFNSILINRESTRSLADLYFKEHFDEIKHRIYHTLIFFLIVSSISFSKMKFLVKILEKPVSSIQFFQLSPGEYFFSTLIIAIYTGLIFCTPFVLGQTVFFFWPSFKTIRKKYNYLFINKFSIIIFIRFSFFLFHINSSSIKFFYSLCFRSFRTFSII